MYICIHGGGITTDGNASALRMCVKNCVTGEVIEYVAFPYYQLAKVFPFCIRFIFKQARRSFSTTPR